MSYWLHKKRALDSIKVEKKLEDGFLVFSYADGTKDEYQICEPKTGNNLRYILVEDAEAGNEEYYLVEKAKCIEKN